MTANPKPDALAEPQQSEPHASTGPELCITRIFDAPREVVWKAWTDPKRALQWWGPRDYPATVLHGEVREGASWRCCLHGEGRDLWQGGVYREVREPERLVFTFAWDADDADNAHQRGHETVVTVTFEEQGDRTRMTFHQAYFTGTQQRDGHFGGWTSTFDRLEELLQPERLPA